MKQIKREREKKTFYTNRFSMLELFSFWGVYFISIYFLSLSSAAAVSCHTYTYGVYFQQKFYRSWCTFSFFLSPFFHLAIFIVLFSILSLSPSLSFSFFDCVCVAGWARYFFFDFDCEHSVILSVIPMNIGNVDIHNIHRYAKYANSQRKRKTE